MLNDNLPSIDLHGESRDVARILVDRFINEAIILKYKKIAVIHGIGTGTLKKEVHNLLKYHRNVDKFYLDFMNGGSTIIELK